MTASADPEAVVRAARPDDVDAVVAFTRGTWGDRHDDYLSRTFPEWVESDDADSGTFVATAPPEAVDAGGLDGRADGDTHVEGDGSGAVAAGETEAVVGCIQAVSLSAWEAWAQGLRVDPAARGLGVSTQLSTAAFDWARDRGASVCRNMVYSWNVAGLGQSRAVGFEPATEFRFVRPEPSGSSTEPSDPAEPSDSPTDLPADAIDDPDPNAAWAFWTDGDDRTHLRGLALDADEPWACSELTREQLRTAAEEGRLLAVRGSAPGVTARDVTGRERLAGFAVRTRVADRAGDEPDRIAVYGIATWRDADAAGRLFESISADAAAVGADVTRVLIPETVERVSDAALNRVPVSGEPDFVMRTNLTGGDSVDDPGDEAGASRSSER